MRRWIRMSSPLLLYFVFLLPTKAQPPAGEPELPSKFDLRTADAVTPIKQQQGGTCWAHGTMAAIESHMLVSGFWKSNGMAEFPAVSEYHLDWWNGFNKHVNDDAGADVGKAGLRVHQGGDYRVSAAYLSRGDGIVCVPRDKDNNLDIKGWYKEPPARHDANYKRFYVRNIEWFTIGDNLENIDAVKRRIMKVGALGTAYAVSKGSLSKDFVHYQPASSKGKPNHAVAIVGWDDGKVGNDEDKRAPKPGAWLIKNSWGTKRGDQGYYWISYFDKVCCRDPEMGAVSFRNLEPMAYKHIYLHDYHGWRGTMKEVSKAFNAFTACDHHRIKAVSFYTAEDRANYTVKIYGRFEDGKLQDEKASKSGTIDVTGFHTIDLDSPVSVWANEKFYVCLEVSAGGQAIDRTSQIPVLLQQKQKSQGLPLVISRANPGESFYWDGRRWKDLHDYTFENPDWGTFDRTANFCMKALAQ